MKMQSHCDLGAPDDIDGGKTGGNELDLVLSRLFDTILPFGIVLGGLALSLSVYRSIRYEWYATLAMHTAIYGIFMVALAFRRRLPGVFLFSLMIGFIGIDTVHSLFLFGLGGPGIMSLAMMCVLTGIFFGIRAGLITMAIGVAVVSCIGAGICMGFVNALPDLEAHLKAPINWILPLFLMMTYALPFIVATHGMKERLLASLDEQKRANLRMEEEIASRVKTEAKLRASEENYRSLFQNAVEGIFQVDRGGRLLNANASLARITGYGSAEEMVGAFHLFEEQLFLHPEDRGLFREMLKEHGELDAFEAQVQRKDGSILWALIKGRTVLDDNGRPAGFEGAMEDVTQRKLAEIALQESEAKYRGLVENSLFGFCILQGGAFRFVNRRFCDISGYAPEEILGKLGPLDLVHPEDRARIAEFLNQIQANGSVRRDFESRGITKKGKIKTIRVSSTSLTYEGMPAVCCAIIDVTNEKALESQLHHARKMEAIGTLTGGIAHDFNNILTALAGYGNMLQVELDESDRLRTYADQICSAASRAAKLTQSLLLFSRKQPVSLSPLDLNDAVEGAKKLLSRLITEDITLVTELTTENTVVMADAVQIDQILFNLASNAKDAMPNGGKFLIQTQLHQLDKDFAKAHGFGEPGAYVLLSVSDTGIGMEEEIRQRVFDPFFTTKGEGKGTGLGLSTVYGIVKQHNGYITIYSEPGEGTSFHIYLPSINAAAHRETEDTPDMSRGRETIIIAEDDQFVREMIRSVLGQFGYETISAVNGEEALRKFREHKGIELAILDTVMPVKNGLEASEEMRKENPSLKVIFTSGYSRTILQEKGIGEDKGDFLPKPFSQNDLLKKVREVLDR